LGRAAGVQERKLVYGMLFSIKEVGCSLRVYPDAGRSSPHVSCARCS
jgi:hypothetical protein